MEVFKGTDRNMRSDGLQYEIGKTVEVEGDIKMRDHGLHACEMPLDVLAYYAPCESRYFEAELEDVSEERRKDSKRVGRRLTLGAELSLAGLVEAQVEYVSARTGDANAERCTGDHGAASATGAYGAASATGFQGVASATGFNGAASATGFQGAASATGFNGAASATGVQGVASATEFNGAASATGFNGAASATGNHGAASATGFQSAASATGAYGAASATGAYGAASATGVQGVASATGFNGAASATGFQGAASATGNHGVASATGVGCVAMTTDCHGMVKGAVGNAIVCVERGDWDEKTFPIKAILAAIVDGETIKADTWYTVVDGNWKECNKV